MVWIHTKTQVNEQGEVEYLITPESLAKLEAEQQKAEAAWNNLQARRAAKLKPVDSQDPRGYLNGGW